MNENFVTIINTVCLWTNVSAQNQQNIFESSTVVNFTTSFSCLRVLTSPQTSCEVSPLGIKEAALQCRQFGVEL